MRILDPGWKKIGSGIRDKHPGSATLLEILITINILLFLKVGDFRILCRQIQYVLTWASSMTRGICLVPSNKFSGAFRKIKPR
jgi:hypothetical protein